MKSAAYKWPSALLVGYHTLQRRYMWYNRGLPLLGFTYAFIVNHSSRNTCITTPLQVLIECHGLSQPLLTMNGSCYGLQISLDSSSIPFGAIVLQSKNSRRLLMMNTGDIGARQVLQQATEPHTEHIPWINLHRFQWDQKCFAPDYSISPVKGYISPGMEVHTSIYRESLDSRRKNGVEVVRKKNAVYTLLMTIKTHALCNFMSPPVHTDSIWDHLPAETTQPGCSLWGPPMWYWRRQTIVSYSHWSVYWANSSQGGQCHTCTAFTIAKCVLSRIVHCICVSTSTYTVPSFCSTFWVVQYIWMVCSYTHCL